MSYLALARKWRPRSFAQLVGQEPVVQAIINSFALQRIHHAYLFTGTRGVGKTSTARLMAKSLNCEQGISANPCLKCAACLSIEQGNYIDLIEIDAASKTRVEDTRELLDNVQYAPSGGRFKIYLIDEVHMLSSHSFNALLKTLEEPPAHVIFILATTDPQKIPPTILSRCINLHLKAINEATISKQLAYILNEESLSFDADSLNILAKAAHGSMRDALSLLDQAIASCNGHLAADQIKQMLGYTKQHFASLLLDALIKTDAAQLLQLSAAIAEEGGNFIYVLNELLAELHNIMVAQALGAAPHYLDNMQRIEELTQQISPEDCQLFYQIALKGQEDIHLAPTLRVGFEVILLRMLTFKPAEKKTFELANSPQVKKRAPQQSVSENIATEPQIIETEVQPPEISLPNGVAMPNEQIAAHQDKPDVIAMSEPLPSPTIPSWEALVKQLALTALTLHAAENAVLLSVDNQKVNLRAAKSSQSLFTPNVQQRIEEALSKFFAKKMRISINYSDTLEESPALKRQEQLQQEKQAAVENISNDPFVAHLKQHFSAELIFDSIESIRNSI